MVKIVSYFMAISLIIASNKGLFSLQRVHVWKETDSNVNRNLHCFSLSISSCFKLISMISLYLMSALNDFVGIQGRAVSIDRNDRVKN